MSTKKIDNGYLVTLNFRGIKISFEATTEREIWEKAKIILN